MRTILAAGRDILAVDVPAVTPPGSDKIMTVAGYVVWGVAIFFFVVFLVVCASAVKAHHQGSRSEGGTAIIVTLLLAAVAGVAGQILTPLIG